jgi:hypothetical protein
MLNNIIKFQDYFLGIMKHSITSDTINWNNIIKKEVRDINDTYLGKVQGISEPFIITEKGNIIKEKFYIPKNLLEGYDDIIVYCRISEREARNNFIRNLQPLHEDYYSNYKITEINKEARLQYKIDEKNVKIDTSLNDEAAFIKNTEGTSTQMTEIMQIVARTTEQKIKEAQIVIKNLQEANLDTIAKEIFNKIRRLSYAGFKVAANLSNISQVAMQFTNSFGDILSEIRRRTY